MGPPGTGKGTQATRLSAAHGLRAISSGDTLRNEIHENTDIGRRARPFVESGGLVPDEVITEVMLAGIDRIPDDAGFLLDGFPRTVPQAEALDAGLTARGRKLDAVLDFQLDDQAIVDRIVSRLVCKKCGRTYNTRFHPPTSPGQCDNCGSELSQRADDSEAVVQTRLKTYREQTAPLIGYYGERGILRGVDASSSADVVEREISAIVRSLGKR
ncbi:MAG: adenylate kinase [Phycisphaerales bacterium]|nr:adenylate kinase [Phycisphaerales bacterium]